jgi:hypothetical protein
LTGYVERKARWRAPQDEGCLQDRSRLPSSSGATIGARGQGEESPIIDAKRLLLLGAAIAVFLFANTAASQSATLIYDGSPVYVRAAPRTAAHRRDCPTCYKGYDFGSDCFQYVWDGFHNTWSNVCLWGWH